MLNAHYEEADGEATRNQNQAGYDYRWFYLVDWFAVGNAEYFQDKIRDINQRVTLGAGLGHRFWDEPTGKLTAELSLAATYEDLRLQEAETNPALRWAMDYNRFFRDKQWELFHRNRVLKIFDNERGEVINSVTGVRFALNARWHASMLVDVQYETEPQPGFRRTDVTYAVGLGARL